MKILIIGNFHHKNAGGLINIAKYLNYEIKYGNINDIPNYDIIFIPDQVLNTGKFDKNKKFIFGPHLSIFPDTRLYTINNVNNNSIYIQPSDWAKQCWNIVNQLIPIKTFCFPVSTEKFKSIREKKEKVFIYFKRRKPEELLFITKFLKSKQIEFRVFDYIKRYDEKDYIKYLQESKYGIWLGAHESQGFALQEALSCNVPLLVWTVTSMQQEEGSNFSNIQATSIPYWDERCGDFFYKKEEFETKYNEFINKLDTYKPREYVLENLSVEKCTENFKGLFTTNMI
jgi:hypothetical protein